MDQLDADCRNAESRCRSGGVVLVTLLEAHARLITLNAGGTHLMR